VELSRKVTVLIRLAWTQYFPLSVEDYLLGISDLTGEIMRLSITAIGAQRSSLADLLAVCNLIRGWYAGQPAFLLTPRRG
jgi:predicted translin family RNA/ssDNA-binding protein